MYVRLAFVAVTPTTTSLVVRSESTPFPERRGALRSSCFTLLRAGRVVIREGVLDHAKLVFDGSTSDAVRILREGFQRDTLIAPHPRRRRGDENTDPRDRRAMTDQGGEQSVARTADTIKIRIRPDASNALDWVTAFSLDITGEAALLRSVAQGGPGHPEGDATVMSACER